MVMRLESHKRLATARAEDALQPRFVELSSMNLRTDRPEYDVDNT
jgi:hypothetical protein